ncbi:unnamed protein product [marine sediment metagenome]|uniref:Uncharacterized protein n=1 Tax=marine sediment metagenome TaxID=412755 RepID=X1FTE1_9ZZZZ
MDDIDKEKEVIKQKKMEAMKEKMVPVDEDVANFINPDIPQAVERPTQYSTVHVSMYKFQRDYVNSIQKHLGINIKSNFMKHAILMFCIEQKKIIDAKHEADEEFKKAYKNWRRKYLIEKFKLKEKIAELNRMAPAQDDNKEDPFTVEDLME